MPLQGLLQGLQVLLVHDAQVHKGFQKVGFFARGRLLEVGQIHDTVGQGQAKQIGLLLILQGRLLN